MPDSPLNQWKPITADFSDANQLFAVAAKQADLVPMFKNLTDQFIHQEDERQRAKEAADKLEFDRYWKQAEFDQKLDILERTQEFEREQNALKMANDEKVARIKAAGSGDGGTAQRIFADWVSFLSTNPSNEEMQQRAIQSKTALSVFSSPKDVAKNLNIFDGITNMLGVTKKSMDSKAGNTVGKILFGDKWDPDSDLGQSILGDPEIVSAASQLDETQIRNAFEQNAATRSLMNNKKNPIWQRVDLSGTTIPSQIGAVGWNPITMTGVEGFALNSGLNAARNAAQGANATGAVTKKAMDMASKAPNLTQLIVNNPGKATLALGVAYMINKYIGNSFVNMEDVRLDPSTKAMIAQALKAAKQGKVAESEQLIRQAATTIKSR